MDSLRYFTVAASGDYVIISQVRIKQRLRQSDLSVKRSLKTVPSLWRQTETLRRGNRSLPVHMQIMLSSAGKAAIHHTQIHR